MRLSDTDSIAGSTSVPVNFAGAVTFSSSAIFNGPTIYGRQTFSATGSISATGAPIVEFTGSTASQTITLPTAASGLTFVFINNASVAVTLSGNAQNIDGSASMSVPAGGCVIAQADTATWHTEASNVIYNNSTYGRLASVNSWSSTNTYTSQVSLNGRWVMAGQALLANGTSASQTVASATSSGTYVSVTGSTVGTTINLPAAPTGNTIFLLKNLASVSVTFLRNGNTIDNLASDLTLTSLQCRWLRFSSSNYDIIGGYG